jgi:hypothetical protein
MPEVSFLVSYSDYPRDLVSEYGKSAAKLRSGPASWGVEGLPEDTCPLDPEPGLGGILSLGLLAQNASVI